MSFAFSNSVNYSHQGAVVPWFTRRARTKNFLIEPLSLDSRKSSQNYTFKNNKQRRHYSIFAGAYHEMTLRCELKFEVSANTLFVNTMDGFGV